MNLTATWFRNRSFRYKVISIEVVSLKQWNCKEVSIASSIVCAWTRKTVWVNFLCSLNQAHSTIHNYTEYTCIVMTCTVFSLNFSSASKGPFMASKTKKNVLEAHFPGEGRGSGEGDIATISLWNLGTKFPETSCPHLPKSAAVNFGKQFKMFDSNNLTLSSMLSFQNAWPLCILRYTSIYSFITLQDRIGSQLEYFLK